MPKQHISYEHIVCLNVIVCTDNILGTEFPEDRRFIKVVHHFDVKYKVNIFDKYLSSNLV